MNWETGTFDTSYLSNNYCYFELIEDNSINRIDIDSIEELERYEEVIDNPITMLHEVHYKVKNEEVYKKIDILIQAVKQLNKEIKELKK